RRGSRAGGDPHRRRRAPLPPDRSRVLSRTSGPRTRARSGRRPAETWQSERVTEAPVDRDARPPRPTLAQFLSVARRPRWIGALVLSLAIASGFAALGQWQLDRSVQNATVPEVETETPVPLATVARPQAPMTD